MVQHFVDVQYLGLNRSGYVYVDVDADAADDAHDDAAAADDDGDDGGDA